MRIFTSATHAFAEESDPHLESQSGTWIEKKVQTVKMHEGPAQAKERVNSFSI